MKKPILYFNESSFQNKQRELNALALSLTSVLQEFNSLGLPFTINTLPDLLALVEGKSKWLQDRIVESVGSVNAGPFRLKPETVLENLELPDFSNLLTFISQVETVYNAEKHLTLTGNSVLLNKDSIENLRESYTTRAEDENEEACIKALERIAKDVQTIGKVFPLYDFTQLKDILFFSKTGEIEPQNFFFGKNLSELNKYRKAKAGR